ncbi:MAG: ATP-binding cassette domain-containing protein [Clostridia bacterium]|nr:ATP-binding cassette domain-containing protein [Clostridia bacterium]
MLTLTDLSFSYGDKTVIDHLSFTFPTRGIVALMGPSGVGKTTLLHLTAGLLKPTHGEVTSTYRKTAVSFQEPRLLNWFNSLDNIKFVLSKDRSSEETALRLLDELGLSAHAKSLPTALSGGEKQRLSLARALAVGADLLLLDEPFAGLDEALCVRAARLIQAANPEGLTVVITHDAKHAQRLEADVLFAGNGAPITHLKPH